MMDYPDANVICRTEEKHTHLERLRFPKQVERELPKGFDTHPIADKRCTLEHTKVKAWL